MKCPNCGKEIADDSKFCPGCGKQLKTIKYVCPKCGGSVNHGDKFCANCGQIFSWGNAEVQQSEPQKPQKEEKKTPKINIPSLMIAGGFTFLCFILLIIGFFGTAVVVNQSGSVYSYSLIELFTNNGLAKCYSVKSSSSSFSFAAFDIYIFCLIVMIISFIFMVVQAVLTIVAMAKRKRLHTKLFAPIFLSNAFYLAILRFSAIQQSSGIVVSFGFGPILILLASIFLLINIAVYRGIQCSYVKTSLISIILQYSGLFFGILAIYLLFGPFLSISYGSQYTTASGLSFLVTLYGDKDASGSIVSLAWLIFAFGITTIVFFVDAIMLAVMEKPLASAINSIIGFVFFVIVVAYLTIGYTVYFSSSTKYIPVIQPTVQTVLFYISSMIFANLSIGGFVTQIIGRHHEARA